jgi:hypothetical protein
LKSLAIPSTPATTMMGNPVMTSRPDPQRSNA